MTVGCPTSADVKTPVFGPSEGMIGMAEAIFGPSGVTIAAVAAVGPITEVTGADPIVALDPTKYNNYYKPADYYEEAAAYDSYYDDQNVYSSVDCTLSLGTPSTRLGGNANERPPQDAAESRRVKPSGGRGGASGSSDPLATRRCANCDTTSTPLWRNGPRGPKSLCNACGIRFKKEEKRAAAAAEAANNGGRESMRESWPGAAHHSQMPYNNYASPAAYDGYVYGEEQPPVAASQAFLPCPTTMAVTPHAANHARLGGSREVSFAPPHAQPKESQVVTFAPGDVASKGKNWVPSQKLDAQITRPRGPPNAPKPSFAQAVVGPTTPEIATLRKLFAIQFILRESVQISLRDPRHVMLLFTHPQDCNDIFMQGQIQFNGHFPMRLFRWSPEFNVKTESPGALVWVTFPNLRADLFNESAIRQLCKPIRRDTIAFRRSRARRQRAGKGIPIADTGIGKGDSKLEGSQHVWMEKTAKGFKPLSAVNVGEFEKGEGSSSTLQPFEPTSSHPSPNVVVSDSSLILSSVNATIPTHVVVEQSASLTIEPSVPPTVVEQGFFVAHSPLPTSSPSPIVHVPDPPSLELDLTASNAFDALGELPGDSHEVMIKAGGRPYALVKYRPFDECVEDCELMDAPFTGADFTWYNNYIDSGPMYVFGSKLKRLAQALRGWNRDTFGHIFDKLKALEQDVPDIEAVLETAPTDEAYVEFRRRSALLTRQYRVEDDYWWQKAHTKWVLDGERNYGYFHVIVKDRHRKLYIHRIQGVGNPMVAHAHLDFIPRLVTEDDNSTLCSVPELEEIKVAVFSVDSQSAAGSDGATFFPRPRRRLCPPRLASSSLPSVQAVLHRPRLRRWSGFCTMALQMVNADHFQARYTCYSELQKSVDIIKKKLTPSDLGHFKKESPFGHLLEYPPLQFLAQIIHLLLVHLTREQVDDELRFNIGGSILKFDFGEWCRIIGMPSTKLYGEDGGDEDEDSASGRIRKKFLDNDKGKTTFAHVRKCFHALDEENGGDEVLQFAKLFFAESVLLARDKETGLEILCASNP
ncbi:unnamed protein product [Cuscuta campestris]|uniref:GATA-type domain-containing protein n=1 Tax=Cuscuta campestris TaxID=132261 RepID=A0A484L420_9ASTE|nr:unnamed protein product [Cuscuta campestris]